MPTEFSTDNVLPFGGELYYFPNLFSPEECRYFFDVLQNSLAWKQEPVKLFGKAVMQPRLTAWYADKGVNYSYSGITPAQNNWTNDLQTIKARVEQGTGQVFNSVLLNLYRNGADSMGWHRDNEKELGHNPAIASVTFGGVRKFQVRTYNEKSNLLNLFPENGSCLLMKGEMQTHWEHALPKTTAPCAARINLTFRLIVKP